MGILAALLFAAYGVTEFGEAGHARLTAPSAGGLYPLDWYVASCGVDGLHGGLYHYEPTAHALETVWAGDPRPALSRALLGPDAVRGASTVFLVAGLFARTRRKYGLRGYRFVLIEAGHSMQNLLLAASCLGLRATPIGGYLDAECDRMLHANGVDETVLYAAAVG